MKNFIIIGNGSSGTSWLTRQFHLHPLIEGHFEDFSHTFEESLKVYKANAERINNDGFTYCNKIPFEQVIFRNTHWRAKDFIELAEHFYIIFNFRAFTSWIESWNRRLDPTCQFELKSRWENGFKIAFDILESHPSKIIFNNYECMTLNPESEYNRLCEWLDIQLDNYSFLDQDKPQENKAVQREKWNYLL